MRGLYARETAPTRVAAALALAVTLALPVGAAARIDSNDFEAGSFTTADGELTLPYRIFVPPVAAEPADDTLYPLVIFLHGSVERGVDNHKQVNGQPGFTQFVEGDRPTTHPLFLLAPQLPPGKTWVEARAAVLALIDELEATRPVDPDRIYLTGISLGGHGTWDIVAHAPDRIAAALPQSGRYDEEDTDEPVDLAALATMPIWNIHAADDDVVDAAGSRAIVERLVRAGCRPLYTEYATGGHVIWTAAYQTEGLVEWTLAQRRGQPSTTAPVIALTAPSAETTFRWPDATIDLAGTVDIAIANATPRTLQQLEWRLGDGDWQPMAGAPAAGTVAESAWALTDVPLEDGRNEIAVRALDDAETWLYLGLVIERGPEPQPEPTPDTAGGEPDAGSAADPAGDSGDGGSDGCAAGNGPANGTTSSSAALPLLFLAVLLALAPRRSCRHLL